MNIVTYYTPSYRTIFDEHLLTSVARSRNTDIKIFAKEIPECSWLEAVQQKPRILLSQLTELKKDIVYTDADSELMCILNRDIYRIGATFLSHKLFYKKKTEYIEPLTGSLYIPYSKRSIELLKEWVELTTGELTDGESFKLLTEKYPTDFEDLGINFCYIPGRIYIENPNFVHYQASRTMRRRK